MKKLTASLEAGDIASYNQTVKNNEIATDQKTMRIKKEAVKSEAVIVEKEFKSTTKHYDIDRFKFIFHDDSVFLDITDKVKEHFTFTDEDDRRLLVTNFYSKKFTRHSVNNINTSKISKIDIGWHDTFYRVTLHLKKASKYDFTQTESGVYIKIRDRQFLAGPVSH